jgi:prepilin-type N-terminal cleavage/methylation domain-containing protein
MQNIICNLKSEECGQERCAREYARSSLLDPRSPLSRRGVTLIELLIVILIISILAALVLGVAAVAGETARQAQTRHIVERLHTLLTEYYGKYKTRRVKLNPAVETQIGTTLSGAKASVRGNVLAEARLYAMRELMLMEVPDRWSDVALQPVEDFVTTPVTATPITPVYLNDRTDLSNVYLRRLRQISLNINSITGVQNTATDIKANQGAECLYMVITLACGDGEARSQFKESDIGDSDGDGAPEFLDGWGHPINFLRWAPGFDSQIQLNANNYTGYSDDQWTKDAAKDHDPFDLYRIDQTDRTSNRASAFRLVPLIYSPGRDGGSGLNAAFDYVPWRKLAAFKVNGSAPYLQPRLSPYELDTTSSAPYQLDTYLGTTLDGEAADNVHNHLMGQR